MLAENFSHRFALDKIGTEFVLKQKGWKEQDSEVYIMNHYDRKTLQGAHNVIAPNESLRSCYSHGDYNIN